MKHFFGVKIKFTNKNYTKNYTQKLEYFFGSKQNLQIFYFSLDLKKIVFFDTKKFTKKITKKLTKTQKINVTFFCSKKIAKFFIFHWT